MGLDREYADLTVEVGNWVKGQELDQGYRNRTRVTGIGPGDRNRTRRVGIGPEKMDADRGERDWDRRE